MTAAGGFIRKDVSMKSLTEKANEVAKKFDEGQEIFRRSSVSILLARIQSLEIDAKKNKQRLLQAPYCEMCTAFHFKNEPCG